MMRIFTVEHYLGGAVDTLQRVVRVPTRLLTLRYLEDQLGLGRIVGRLQRVPRYHVLVLAALHALDREDRLGPLGRHLGLVGVQALLEVVGSRDAHGRAWLEGRDVARRPPPVGGGDDGLAYLVPQLRVALHARAEDRHRAAPLLVDRERGVGPRVHDLRRLAGVLRPLLERLALGLEQPPQRSAPDLVRPLDHPRLVGRAGRNLHKLDDPAVRPGTPCRTRRRCPSAASCARVARRRRSAP
eukprot:COSAG05_NODE_2023_length_3681_cov_2.114182_3_plen_242_part_00